MRHLKRRRLALMAQWLANRGPFTRITDLTRGSRTDMARAGEFGRIESVRFVVSDT